VVGDGTAGLCRGATFEHLLCDALQLIYIPLLGRFGGTLLQPSDIVIVR
jgi:hypothetical protein